MTLSENVHKFAELSQRIVVERSVIQETYEQTKNNTKTTEICVRENYNKTVSTTSLTSSSALRVNNEDALTTTMSSLTTPMQHQPAAAEHENNSVEGEIDDQEKNSGSPVKQTNGFDSKLEVDNDSNVVNKNNEKDIDLPPSMKIPEVIVQRPLKPQSEMDFLVPYNIINNYFSVGVVSKMYIF